MLGGKRHIYIFLQLESLGVYIFAHSKLGKVLRIGLASICILDVQKCVYK